MNRVGAPSPRMPNVCRVFVCISQIERGASVRANFEEASSWVAHRKGLVVAEVASVGILKSNPAKY